MRLIDADALKDFITNVVKAQNGKEIDLVPVRELPIVIDKQPTISELEIRNEVIEEFATKALEQFTALEFGDSYSAVTKCKMILHEIKEQMKDMKGGS